MKMSENALKRSNCLSLLLKQAPFCSLPTAPRDDFRGPDATSGGSNGATGTPVWRDALCTAWTPEPCTGPQPQALSPHPAGPAGPAAASRPVPAQEVSETSSWPVIGHLSSLFPCLPSHGCRVFLSYFSCSSILYLTHACLLRGILQSLYREKQVSTPHTCLT